MTDQLRKAAEQAYKTLARAFSRIHALPRSSDTDLANEIETVRAALDAALAAEGETVVCRHEPFEGKCIHCGVAFANGLPAIPGSKCEPAGASDAELVDPTRG